MVSQIPCYRSSEFIAFDYSYLTLFISAPLFFSFSLFFLLLFFSTPPPPAPVSFVLVFLLLFVSNLFFPPISFKRSALYMNFPQICLDVSYLIDVTWNSVTPFICRHTSIFRSGKFFIIICLIITSLLSVPFSPSAIQTVIFQVFWMYLQNNVPFPS